MHAVMDKKQCAFQEMFVNCDTRICHYSQLLLYIETASELMTATTSYQVLSMFHVSRKHRFLSQFKYDVNY